MQKETHCGTCGSPLDPKTGKCPNCDVKAAADGSPAPKKKKKKMSTKTIVLIVLICLVLAGIITGAILLSRQDNTTDAVSSKATSSETAKSKKAPNVADSESDLKQQLQNAGVDLSKIKTFAYGDYDGDGVKEAFAFVAEKSGEEGMNGPLWYATYEGAQKLKTYGPGSDYGFGNVYSAEKIKLGNRSFLTVNMQFGQNTTTNRTWYVKDGTAYETSFSGMLYPFNDKCVAVDDNEYDNSSDGTGQTWKLYYYYWDDASSSFVEYGGKYITQADLKKVKGGSEALQKINALNGTIGDIHYRDNGIININYTTPDYPDISTNNNATLYYDPSSKSVYPLQCNTFKKTNNIMESNYGGVYKKAISNNATYPSKLPW